jgi:hypothetical protein
MAHAWKACWVQALGGSNPPFSADFSLCFAGFSRLLRPLEGLSPTKTPHPLDSSCGVERVRLRADSSGRVLGYGVSMEIASDPFVRSGRAPGVVGICLAAVSVAMVLVAVILMGADTGSSFVGPTDHIGFGLLAVAGVIAIAALVLGVSAISSGSRRIGVIAIVVTVSSVPLSFASLLVLDAVVG